MNTKAAGSLRAQLCQPGSAGKGGSGGGGFGEGGRFIQSKSGWEGGLECRIKDLRRVSGGDWGGGGGNERDVAGLAEERERELGRRGAFLRSASIVPFEPLRIQIRFSSS